VDAVRNAAGLSRRGSVQGEVDRDR
jgi:hypothetical protein